MSAQLFREGDDLDAILAELDAEHPGRVRVVDVSYDRDGGVLGFFARRRVGVKYTVDGSPFDGPAIGEIVGGEYQEGGRAVDHRGDDGAAGIMVSPLDELLSAADAQEMVTSGRLPERGSRPMPKHLAEPANVEFARMLLEVANAKAAERRAAAPAAVVPPAPTAVVPPAVAPTPVVPTAPTAFVAPAVPFPAVVPPATVAAAQFPAAPVDAPRTFEASPVITPAPGAAHRPRPSVSPAPSLPSSSALPPRRAPGAHRADPDDVDDAAEVIDMAPTSTAEPVNTATADAAPTRTDYALRRRLAEIGVPVSWIPDGATDAYRVVEQLAARVPAAPPLELGPGEVLVLAGPAVDALRAARQLCGRLHIDPDNVLAAGCPAGSVPADRTIGQRWQAAAKVADLRRERREPAIVVVATDGATDDGLEDDRWVAGIVSALAPERLWVVLDAGRKPVDCRALLDRVGRADALVLAGAARTASPASAWELGVPFAVVDGRPATRGVWAVLLIDRLATMDQ